MSLSKKTILDLLFGLQIVGALLFCGAMFFRILSDVRGVSLAQNCLVATYLVFHLLLGIGAHRANPSRLTAQAVATYAMWFVLVLFIIGAILSNSSYHWGVQDTTMLWVASLLTPIVFVIGRSQNATAAKTGADPMTKALFAIAYKSVPQALLAWKVWAEGGSGIPGMAVLVGHLTIIIRLIQLRLMVEEAGWDRNRFWLKISELANEGTWVIVTIVWIFK